jgi:dipeptidyl aminopeptidase/acylaminoacyl peptidase
MLRGATTKARGDNMPEIGPWTGRSCIALLILVAVSHRALAEREPVLGQIDVPHSYYYREMYLPQLTAGPSSLTWSPDGGTLVYSMQGSLWRQDVDSGITEQLTAGPGYDYQPDWSPDGSRIAFVRYYEDAMELYLLEVATGAITALTDEGAVNVEPRWSPNGSGLAYVSTRDTGRFHIFVGEVIEDTLVAGPLFEERRSEVPRYYYSAYDHELSPAWSPDGQSIVYVANPEIPYGTGAIWQRSVTGDPTPQLVRMEETSWKAKPDWSPDGNRIAYASYLGRQWHQLWVTTAQGGAEPFPLTYGDFDISSPRWSPDGKQIAYVANESGNTEIRVQDMVGGKTVRLEVENRRYLNPMTTLHLTVVDESGAPVPARVAVVGSDGRSYAPATSWMHADDGFDRNIADFEVQYFHLDREAKITVPAGATRITVWRGMEHEIESLLVNARPEIDNALTISLDPLNLPGDWDEWINGDVHVHMNYGGTYRNTPSDLVAQASAEDLDIVFNLIVNKEQRVPDISYFSTDPDAASNDDVLLLHAQEFHTGFWGHLGLIGLQSHLLLPDYSAYPRTAAASLFPDNATISRLAREQGAAVGYVHPFEPPAPDPQTDAYLTNALPVDAALDLVDYYEVVGFANPRTSADVWYGLLNCGMRLAAAGGTDAMANYASLRGPVGINRTYVRVPDLADDPATRQEQWLDGLKSHRSLATNGPLLHLEVDGRQPGDDIELDSGVHELAIVGFMRSAVPIDHLELIHNGDVVESIDLDGSRKSADIRSSLNVDSSGWILLRAWNEGAHPLIFDLYPYATTSPVYISVGNAPPRSTRDAEYFSAWIDRIRDAVEAHADFNDDSEKSAILASLDEAQLRYEACR